MNLSIIIVNWNTRDLLAQCLDSVYAHPPTGGFEVIVVDNASADGSALMVQEQFPQAILVENNENVGFARANNQALHVSKGRFALLLNSDTVALANTFDPLVRALEEFPQAGVAGPAMYNDDGTLEPSSADFPTLVYELAATMGLSGHYHDAPDFIPGSDAVAGAREVDWVSGACFMVRRECFEEVGLMDESIFMYGEEVDWCYRMWLAGWKTLYIPEAQVIHLGGQSSKGILATKYVLVQRGKVYFFRKHGRNVTAATLSLAIRVVSLAKAGYVGVELLLGAGPRHDLRSRLAGYLAAALGAL